MSSERPPLRPPPDGRTPGEPGDAATLERVTRSRRPPPGLELHSGERIVDVISPWWLVTLGAYIVTLGFWEIWRRRHYLALTDERLVYAKGIVFNKVSRSVPLARVQDATYARRLWAGGIEISSAGGSFGSLKDVGFRPRQAKEFVHALNAATRRASAPGTGDAARPPGAGADPAETIRSLGRLRDDGLITEDEYQAKRQEILSRM